MCSITPDLPNLNSKTPNSPIMESANSDHYKAELNSEDSEDLNITTMSTSSSSASPASSPSSIIDHETNDSEVSQTTKTPTSGCILKFSIEKIMEPEKTRSRKNDVKIEHTDNAVSYDSAFKKYVPNANSMHQFVNRPQDFLSQYPLLYYPNQLMCAAAQYAALTQHSTSVNLLTNAVAANNSSPNGVSTSLTQLSNLAIQSYHNQNHAIKRVNSPSSSGHEKMTASSHLSGGKLMRKALFESPADKKLISSNNHVQTTTTVGNTSSNNSSNAVAAGKPKTFSCLECGKIFNAHYNLTRHMPVHTGARPFVCKVCKT
ncbi:hypothetical protein PVAND_006496 [Polypedilum vanderplanki]|uniref:C2H2-type domain-containing protein n=1 Tax=Polypedilum vanderplanki TaxID=319348 RepID=A0A9J6C3T8_POLVA|nr:hypothetical protein PVAND_006496 [Polypedilum vanderplanki]